MVDPQRDIDRVLRPRRRATACGSPTSSRPTSTTTTSPAAWPWPGPTGAAYHVNADDQVSFDRTPGPRRRRRRGRRERCGSGRWPRPGTPSPTCPTRLERDDGRARSAVFSGGSLLYGATGRPDLLGPEHTHDLVHHQYASAHRLADRAARRRRGLPDPRLRQLLLGHPVRGHRLDHRAGEADQPRPDPGRGDLRRDLLAGLDAYPAYYAHMAPANAAGPAAPDLTPPELADAERAAAADRGRRVGRRPAQPDRVRRRARRRAPSTSASTAASPPTSAG